MKTRRLLTVAKGIFSGQGSTDRRGGKRDRPEYEQKFAAVKKFISELRVNESHYARAKTKRIYLSSELSVAKLHKLYNAKVQENLTVSTYDETGE